MVQLDDLEKAVHLLGFRVIKSDNDRYDYEILPHPDFYVAFQEYPYDEKRGFTTSAYLVVNQDNQIVEIAAGSWNRIVYDSVFPVLEYLVNNLPEGLDDILETHINLLLNKGHELTRHGFISSDNFRAKEYGMLPEKVNDVINALGIAISGYDGKKSRSYERSYSRLKKRFDRLMPYIG